MTCGSYRHWSHRCSSLADFIMLRRKSNKPIRRLLICNLTSRKRIKTFKSLKKNKKILEDKKHRVSNLRSQLYRQLKKATIILVNSLAEMEEIATMKKM
jgi:hypothetical protein